MKSGLRMKRMLRAWTIGGVLFVPLATPALAQNEDAATDPPAAEEEAFDAARTIQRINREFQRNNYDVAVELLEELLVHEPDRARAWSALGYALQQQKRYAEALPAQLMATEFRRTRATACYNIACIYAIRGMIDKSIGWLESAVEAGFQNAELMMTDTDLEKLREDPRFVKLHEAIAWRTTFGPEQSRRDAVSTKETSLSTAPPESLPARRRLEFWVGQWDVFSAGGTHIGTSEVERLLDGHLFRETWTSSRGDSGTSTNYYNAATNEWSQVWVDDNGHIITMSGGYLEGAMRMRGTQVLPDGRVRAFRSRLERAADGTVEQVLESSLDGGASWAVWFEAIYRRQDGSHLGEDGTTMDPKNPQLEPLDDTASPDDVQ